MIRGCENIISMEFIREGGMWRNVVKNGIISHGLIGGSEKLMFGIGFCVENWYSSKAEIRGIVSGYPLAWFSVESGVKFGGSK